MTGVTAVLAQAADSAGSVGTGEAIAFWILGPLAVAGALGMVLARSAVHSALWLVLTMLTLGVLYMVGQAPFLGFVQIIVYTGAIMMLFLFVLMLVGRDSSDSVVEVLRGQRVAALLGGIALAVLLAGALARSLTDVTARGLEDVYAGGAGPAGSLGALMFSDYLFPVELAATLLIIASLGAMVLATNERQRENRRTQREMVHERLRGERARPSPLPGPGVFATANSVGTPALLPDGSVAPESLSELIDSTAREELVDEMQAVAGESPGPDPHALRGSDQHPPSGPSGENGEYGARADSDEEPR